ncbi:MAG TPA: PQQ-dependent sugar dehydrogenase [Candidatus Limnocylindrales bacterium]
MTHHRRRHPRFALLVSIIALVLFLVVPMSVARGATLSLVIPTVRTGFASLTQVTNAGDGTNRLFVVERRGTIRALTATGAPAQSGYFLDIRSQVNDASGERGLLGVAFHPNFEVNRRLFVYYTRYDGDIMVARLQANSSGTRVSASTLRYILRIEHSRYSNHNGGAMVFGPNGYLYLGTGDGGGAGDPLRNGQSKTKNLLGKILRINVDGTGSGPWGRYSVPSTNPFRGSDPGLNEVWAYGLRNPWRISFDRGSQAMYIADVGQNRYEEINRESRNYWGGRNYGWNVMEGKHCYAATTCRTSGKTLPVAEYTHAGGNCSITGGYVYRGTVPGNAALVGLYVFADFCSGKIYTMPHGGGPITMQRDWGQNITSFGEAENGELYLVTIDGRLHRIRLA